MNYRLIAASVAAAALFAGAAQAETATMNVTAEVVDECTALSAAPLAFATNIGGLITADVDATADISVTCNTNATYELALDKGLTADATVTTRQMRLVGGVGGEPTLPYELKSGSQAGSNWGDTAAAGWVTGTGNGAAQTHTVYGRILASTGNIPTGQYSDTITVTLTY